MQVKDKDSLLKWVDQWKSNCGDSGLFGALDDPDDTHAIQVGFSLFYKFRNNPSIITARKIIDELYDFYGKGKLSTIEACGMRCHVC